MKKFCLFVVSVIFAGCIPVGAYLGISEATKNNTNKGTLPAITGAITIAGSAKNGSADTTPIQFTYTLKDGESSPCNLQVEYSTDQKTTWQNATITGTRDGIANLSSSPSGVQHALEWDHNADLPGLNQMGIYVRLTPVDDKGFGTAGEVQTLRLGNTAPEVVQILDIPGTLANPAGSPVTIHFFLKDGESDLSTVEVEYREKDPSTSLWGSWTSATRHIGSPGDPGSQTNHTKNLESNNTVDGKANRYLWDALSDQAGKNKRQVQIRIQVHDQFTNETWISTTTPWKTSAEFTLDNGASLNQPPKVELMGASSALEKNDRYKVAYRLIDTESDSCAVRAEWSLNNGASWFPCKVLTNPARAILDGESPGDPLTSSYPLSSNSSGKVHSFVWDVPGDVNFGGTNPIKVRLTPYDQYGVGASVETVAIQPFSWSATANLSKPSLHSQFPSMGIDSTNKMHLIWSDNSPGNYEIYYSQYNGTPGPLRPISPIILETHRVPLWRSIREEAFIFCGRITVGGILIFTTENTVPVPCGLFLAMFRKPFNH